MRLAVALFVLLFAALTAAVADTVQIPRDQWRDVGQTGLSDLGYTYGSRELATPSSVVTITVAEALTDANRAEIKQHYRQQAGAGNATTVRLVDADLALPIRLDVVGLRGNATAPRTLTLHANPPAGHRVEVVRLHATHAYTVATASGHQKIIWGGASRDSIQLDTPGSVTLRYVANNRWMVTASNGTVSVP